MRDVALVPESNIFVGCLSVGADDSGESADLFAGDRVALVGHRRRAFLLFGEELFGLAHFGPLEMAYFGGDLVERRGDDRQGRDVVGVTVALDHLGCDWRGFEAELRADALFVFGFEMAEGADCSGELADAHSLGRRMEP